MPGGDSSALALRWARALGPGLSLRCPIRTPLSRASGCRRGSRRLCAPGRPTVRGRPRLLHHPQTRQTLPRGSERGTDAQSRRWPQGSATRGQPSRAPPRHGARAAEGRVAAPLGLTSQQVGERGPAAARDGVVPLPDVLEQLVDVVALERVQARRDVVAWPPAGGQRLVRRGLSCGPGPEAGQHRSPNTPTRRPSLWSTGMFWNEGWWLHHRERWDALNRPLRGSGSGAACSPPQRDAKPRWRQCGCGGHGRFWTQELWPPRPHCGLGSPVTGPTRRCPRVRPDSQAGRRVQRAA